MSRYMLIPTASDDLVEVATGTGLKTVLQLATPSTTNIQIVAWGISLDGVVVTEAPGRVQLVEVNVAATVTLQTPDKWGNSDDQASLCVGGTSASGYNASAEGSVTVSRFLDGENVHPQTGYSIWFPDKAGPTVQKSQFLRIRTTFAVDRNCIPWILYDEPA